jgi:hypothetical protein
VRRADNPLSPSFADCLEIWEPKPPGTLRACFGISFPLVVVVVVVVVVVAAAAA